MSDNKVFIYGLSDPISRDVRYIGKSIDPKKRFQAHLSIGQLNRYRSIKNSWIKSLLAKGFSPDLVILDCVEGRDANEAEMEYINFFRERAKLTNGTDGGDGGAVIDPEARARIRAAHLGSKASEATKKQMSESAKRRCEDPKERARLAKISNGKPPVRVGEDNNKSKLTESDVREIRRLVDDGVARSRVATKYGITPQNLYYIIQHKTWKHVE